MAIDWPQKSEIQKKMDDTSGRRLIVQSALLIRMCPTRELLKYCKEYVILGLGVGVRCLYALAILVIACCMDAVSSHGRGDALAKNSLTWILGEAAMPPPILQTVQARKPGGKPEGKDKKQSAQISKGQKAEPGNLWVMRSRQMPQGAVKRLKNNKSPGVCIILPEKLNRGGDNVHLAMRQLILSI